MNSDSLPSVLNAFKNYPSIKNIKSEKFNSTFSFESTYTDVVMKVINNLNIAKTCQVNDVPTKVIKMSKDIFANFITDHFNCCIAYGEFPDKLKHADVIPVHKKNEKWNKANYNISKIYEKLLYNQVSKYFDSLLAANQWGISKRLQFTVLSFGDAGKVQGSNRYRKSIWDTFNRSFESF